MLFLRRKRRFVCSHAKADIRWAVPPHQSRFPRQLLLKEKPIRFDLMSVFVRRERRVIVLQKADISGKASHRTRRHIAFLLRGRWARSARMRWCRHFDECSVLYRQSFLSLFVVLSPAIQSRRIRRLSRHKRRKGRRGTDPWSPELPHGQRSFAPFESLSSCRPDVVLLCDV